MVIYGLQQSLLLHFIIILSQMQEKVNNAYSWLLSLSYFFPKPSRSTMKIIFQSAQIKRGHGHNETQIGGHI